VHNFESFLDNNFAGYAGGIDQCMGNVMCSYQAVNRIPMSINAMLVSDVLKGGYKTGQGFDGFVISDYDEIGKVAGQGWPTSNIKMSWEDAIEMIINSGIDMMMLANTNPSLTIEWFQSRL
jgi:beta-glucosidase-like glycosyl hydrolase